MLQQIHTLLETTCPQKLLECHRIHFQGVNLSHRIGFSLMKRQAEKGTGYCHMIFPCIFTEILQRGKSTMQLLYFIHNDEGLAGFYINTSNSSDGEKDAIYIIVWSKQILSHGIVVTVNVGHIFKLTLPKFLQDISFANLSCSQQNKGFSILSVFPSNEVLHDKSFHILLFCCKNTEN